MTEKVELSEKMKGMVEEFLDRWHFDTNDKPLAKADLSRIIEEAVREYCEKHNLVKLEIEPGTLDVLTPDD